MTRDNLFTRWHYDYIDSSSTREEYITRIGKLANVANKRAKTLVKADEKGRIDIENTAYIRYRNALKKVNEYTNRHYTYISTGKGIYKDLRIGQLRGIERELLHYLEAETSTARGALDVEERRRSTLEENYGLNLSLFTPIQVQMIFNAMNYLVEKNFKEMSSDRILKYMTQKKDGTKLDHAMSTKELIKIIEEMYDSDTDEDYDPVKLRAAIEGRTIYQSSHIKGDKQKPKFIKVKRKKE